VDKSIRMKRFLLRVRRPSLAALSAMLLGFGVCAGGLSLGRAVEVLPNPEETRRAPVSPVRGRQLFVQSCAHCHGEDARGDGEDGDGPNLVGLAIGNGRIAAVIRSGIPDEMPAFGKKHGSADIADLTAYLRAIPRN